LGEKDEQFTVIFLHIFYINIRFFNGSMGMTKVDVALWLISIGIFAWGTCFGWLVRKLFMENKDA